MCILHHPFSKAGHFFAISTKRVTVSVPVSKLTLLKEKKTDKTNIFEGFNSDQQADIEKIVSEYDVLFQEPKGLPPKKEIGHDIILQQDVVDLGCQ